MRSLQTRLARSTAVRFLVVGGLSYLVNQLCLVLLYHYAFASLPRGERTLLGAIDVGLLVASSIAVEVSIVVRFFLNDRWTFKDRCGKTLGKRFMQSNVTSFGSPVISLATINLLTPHFGVSYLIANSIGVALGLAWNWFCSTRLVWKRATVTPAMLHF